MTSIEVCGKIISSDLDQNHYVESLLHLAVVQGLLPPSKSLRLQQKLSVFIEEESFRFVGGMSSSLPKEKVQSLAASILYQLSYALQDSPNPEIALQRLQSEPLHVLQKIGCQQIHLQVQKGKKLLKTIQTERVKLPLQAYQDTIMTGIPLFFSSYDVEYEAHETPGAIDYPLAIALPDCSGIRYINRYLEQIHLENQFCRMFSPTRIHRLLRCFDPHYEVLLLNLFEHVFANALACSMAHTNPLILPIHPETLGAIERAVKALSLEELAGSLQLAASSLQDEFNLTNKQLRSLIQNQCQALLPRIHLARQFDSLDRIWIPNQEQPVPPANACLDSARLTNQAFRSLSEEIRSCRYMPDKQNIIASHIHNRWDLLELIECDCLTDQELLIFFQSLEPKALAFLLKSFQDYQDTTWYANLFDIFRKTRHNKQG